VSFAIAKRQLAQILRTVADSLDPQPPPTYTVTLYGQWPSDRALYTRHLNGLEWFH
jgi:hypothetical protein